MNNTLALTDVRFSYDQKEVLRNLSLSMAAGQIHGILGRNGAGKTTLFNILYARLRPETGTCLWNGSPLTYTDIAFQETQSYFYPYLKGREYLELVTQHNPDFPIDQWNQIFELSLNQLVDGYSRA